MLYPFVRIQKLDPYCSGMILTRLKGHLFKDTLFRVRNLYIIIHEYEDISRSFGRGIIIQLGIIKLHRKIMTDQPVSVGYVLISPSGGIFASVIHKYDLDIL